MTEKNDRYSVGCRQVRSHESNNPQEPPNPERPRALPDTDRWNHWVWRVNI
ncbi:hypothetical protein QUB00_26680 [Microcoleus sp. F8_C2]